MALKQVMVGLSLAGVAGMVCAQAPGAGRMVDNGLMQVGRYTAVSAEPFEQISDPLATQVRLSFPRQTVQTVGDAVEHTLLRTGWTLVERIALDAPSRHVLGLPLPESQRTVGPAAVRQVLMILLGASWQWQEDPVRRQLSFALKPEPVQTVAIEEDGQALTKSAAPGDSSDLQAGDWKPLPVDFPMPAAGEN